MTDVDGHLSFAEEQLWLADRDGAAALPFFDCAPSLFIAARLEGPLHRQALEHSLTEIVRRHDVLRSRFGVRDGRPVRTYEPASRVRLMTLDLRRAPHEDRSDLAARALLRRVKQRFDLVRGPLFRAVLVTLSDAEHIFALSVHHIVFDRWSKRVLAQELRELYDAYAEGRTPALAPLPARYEDYVRWQRDRVNGPLGRELIEYWTSRLSGAGDLALPRDAGGERMTSTRSATWWFAIHADDARRLTVMSRRWRVTVTTVMLAVLQLVLSKVTGRDDITAGVPLSDRRSPEFEHLIGLFMNVVVVRTSIPRGITFLEVLDRVRRALVDACRYQDLPYGYLSKAIAADRPLYRVVFNFVPGIPASELELPGLQVTPLQIDSDRVSLADLSLHIHHDAGRFACRIEYKADLFSPARIRDLAAQFQALVTAVLDAPDACVDAYDPTATASAYQRSPA